MKEIVLLDKDVARFWSKVDRSGDNGCWVWTGGLSKKGYGVFTAHGRNLASHRVSYFLRTGVWTSLQVLHECPGGLDNPGCVNPDHLVAGTHAANMGRRDSLGRQAKGERMGTARLTEGDVRAILDAGVGGEWGAVTRLARQYGVTTPAISDILRGVTWRHVSRTAVHEEAAERYRRPHIKLTPEGVREILESVEGAKALAARYGVCESAIYYIRSGRLWPQIPRFGLEDQ